MVDEFKFNLDDYKPHVIEELCRKYRKNFPEIFISCTSPPPDDPPTPLVPPLSISTADSQKGF